MTAYYNEIDPVACAALRELIASGVIADGVVDERSIKEVQPDDLRGFDQVHSHRSSRRKSSERCSRPKKKR